VQWVRIKRSRVAGAVIKAPNAIGKTHERPVTTITRKWVFEALWYFPVFITL